MLEGTAELEDETRSLTKGEFVNLESEAGASSPPRATVQLAVGAPSEAHDAALE